MSERKIDVKKIKNIVFDLGDVLIRLDREKYLENYIPKEKQKLFYNTVWPTEEWLMLDRGTLTYDEAKNIFKSKAPEISKEIDNFFDKDFFEILNPIEENVELVCKLKGKYNLYVLSNFHKDSFEYVFENNEFFKLFDGCVVSCYCHLLKPEREIYEELITKYHLIPEETVFIDDTKVNIEAFEEVGINGIHLPDFTKLEEKLEEFLK